MRIPCHWHTFSLSKESNTDFIVKRTDFHYLYSWRNRNPRLFSADSRPSGSTSRHASSSHWGPTAEACLWARSRAVLRLSALLTGHTGTAILRRFSATRRRPARSGHTARWERGEALQPSTDWQRPARGRGGQTSGLLAGAQPAHPLHAARPRGQLGLGPFTLSGLGTSTPRSPLPPLRSQRRPTSAAGCSSLSGRRSLPWPRPAALGILLRYLTARPASLRPRAAGPRQPPARLWRVLRAIGEIIARLELQPLVINGCLWAARSPSAWLSSSGVRQCGGRCESFACFP